MQYKNTFELMAATGGKIVIADSYNKDGRDYINMLIESGYKRVGIIRTNESVESLRAGLKFKEGEE